jgi:glyoxylase-like metal-dependent hydrolase (beta-lactamase superfamily II)
MLVFLKTQRFNLWLDFVDVKLTENIQMIDGTMANCYTVTLDGKVILIDSGMKSSSKKIINHFESQKIKPDIVLITHCHVDHIGGLSDISSEFHPEIFVPDKEVEIARGNEKMPTRGGVISAMAGLMKARPVSEVSPLSKLKLPGMTAMDTNGHTPGSTSFSFGSLGAIFVGDAVSENEGRYEFNKSFTLDPKNAEISIKRILELHGTMAYPGHGKPFKIP